ncbi:DUF11 domain-containing protein [Fibrella aquatilis]|uniref:DUF11 domain-containing protein n=1 Tax=Fibrella aquatilis TaxID=2817059 RepID=A0A939G0E8_9BACT|nr:DUF11 domain-containing protein [Fibrella aquatilis]MBO0930087.1 DUF11 domain-containing protein [Fibrella aquatilis]
MKTYKHCLQFIMLLLLGWQSVLAQVTYKVDIDPAVTSTIRYRVFMTSAQSYTGTNQIISTAQVTLLIPNGGTAGGSVNYIANVVGKSGKTPSNLTQQMNWNPAIAGGPVENPQLDYLSFGFSYGGNPVSFSITANQAIELFHFDYTGPCPGAVYLIESAANSPNPDPFLKPNSLGTGPENQMTIYGFGTQNAYVGNQGGTADCRTTFPDLRASIAGPANLAQGGTASYAVNLSNIGAASTIGIYSTTVALPAGVSFTSGAGAGWTFSSSLLGNGTTQVVAKAANTVIGAGGTNAFTLNVATSASASSGAAVISGGVGGGSEINLANNAFSQNVSIGTVAASADLVASMAGPGGLVAGGTGSYVVSLTNIGGAATAGAYSTTLILPAGVTLSSGSGTGWSFASTLLGNGTTQVVATASAAIAQNAMGAFTLNVAVSGAAASANVAISGAVGGGGEVNLGNNAFAQNVTITAAVGTSPDISVGINGPSVLTQNNPGSYSLTVTNAGSGATTGPTTITASLAAGTTLNSISGPGWSVTTTAGPGGTTLLTAVYANPIAGGGSVASPLILNVTPNTTSAVGLTGAASTPGETNTGNNSFALGVPVIPVQATLPPDLSVSLTGPSVIAAGVPANFVFGVSNGGTGPTTGPSVLTIPLPAGMSYIGAIGNGWTCATNATPAVSCTYVAIIPAGQSAPNLSLGLSAASSLTGTSVNLQGTINTPGDPVPGNNSSTPKSVAVTSAAAGTQADLTTTVFMSTQAPNQYEALTATVVVTNLGPASATGVVSQVTLPTGYPITSIQSAAGTAFTSGNGVWTIGSLAAGQSVTLTVTMSAATSGQATVASSVTSTGGNDPALANNAAQTCFSVPYNLCAGGSFAATIPGAYTSIQWFRNNQPINGATSNTLTITQDGTYTVSTTGGAGTCASGSCCPIYVRQAINCCEPSACIPITIRKTK